MINGADIAEGTRKGFLHISLFDHVTASMRIYKEEIFGPVLHCACPIWKRLFNSLMIMYGNGTAIFMRMVTQHVILPKNSSGNGGY